MMAIKLLMRVTWQTRSYYAVLTCNPSLNTDSRTGSGVCSTCACNPPAPAPLLGTSCPHPSPASWLSSSTLASRSDIRKGIRSLLGDPREDGGGSCAAGGDQAGCNRGGAPVLRGPTGLLCDVGDIPLAAAEGEEPSPPPGVGTPLTPPAAELLLAVAAWAAPAQLVQAVLLAPPAAPDWLVLDPPVYVLRLNPPLPILVPLLEPEGPSPPSSAALPGPPGPADGLSWPGGGRGGRGTNTLLPCCCC
jgi:hypothetical protein